MTMPNFLIIGAMKSGTTALYHYLRQHPQIYLNSTLKELRFFCYEGHTFNFKGPGDEWVYASAITNIEDYRKFFRGVTSEKAAGDASVEYLYVPGTAERIRAYIPSAKLIAILRHPVDRAYSNYLHWIREGLEPCADFAEALRQEPKRTRQNWSPGWHYLQVGFYYGQLKRYFDTFDPDQIRIYLYDDFQANPVALIEDIFRFLRVDDSFVPNMTLRHNVAGIPRSRALHKFLYNRNLIKTAMKPFLPTDFRLTSQEMLRKLNQRWPPPLDPALGRQLLEIYREDIFKLQDLLDRNLSHWLQIKENGSNGNLD